MRDIGLTAGAALAACLLWYVLPSPLIAMGWGLMGLAFLSLGFTLPLPILRLHAHLLFGIAFLRLFMANFTPTAESAGLSHRFLTVTPFVVLLILLMVLFLGAALAVYVGETDEEPADFSSVMEIWGDVLRDLDEFGLQLTRVSDGEEMRVGKELAATRFWTADGAWQSYWEPYVSAVMQTLLPHVRRKGIRYEVNVVRSSAVNAFALPGGRIYITTAMLDFLENEAELAAVLGHEIAHVDLRHCIERLQYEAALKRVGLGEIGQLADIGRRLVSVGYNKYQEMEADAQGARMSIEAGYDPDAAAVVFHRMQLRFAEKTSARPGTPVEELAQAVGGALGDYLRSHPPSAERRRRLEALVERNHRRLAGRSFYLGKKNYAVRQAREQQRFPEEERLWIPSAKPSAG